MGATARLPTLTRFPTAVWPIIGIMAGACGWAGFYVSRLATRPDVVWNHKSNPQPYLKVQQHETIKMYDSTGKFAGWRRTEF